MSEPPSGWGRPPEPSDEPPDPATRAPDAWPAYGASPANVPQPNSPAQWGNFSSPPGWSPPPRTKMRKSQIFGGIGAWFGVNAVLAMLAGAVGDYPVGGLALLGLAVNVAFIVVPALKGHKAFAVGYALGFVVAFVLALGACFLLIAAFSGNGWI